MKLYSGFHTEGRPQATMRSDTGNKLPNGFLRGRLSCSVYRLSRDKYKGYWLQISMRLKYLLKQCRLPLGLHKDSHQGGWKEGYKSPSDHDNGLHEAVHKNGIQDIRLPQGNDRKQELWGYYTSFNVAEIFQYRQWGNFRHGLRVAIQSDIVMNDIGPILI